MKKPIKNIWVILALILFFPLGLFLMWKRTNWEKGAKWVVTAVFGVLVLMTITNSSSSDKKTATLPDKQVVEKTQMETPKPTPTPSPNPNQARNDYINTFTSQVLPLMQDGNDKVSEAGKAGSNQDFGTAKTDIGVAIQDFDKAQTALGAIRNIPPEMSHVNNLITNALAKEMDGVLLMQQGVNNYNATTIEQGTTIYSQGTDFLTQAAAELQKYK